MLRKVACGVSGGVDSAVAAYLLQKNFNVTGVFMSNWDLEDENAVCTINKDREDAKYVCDHLKIPFQEVSFVKEYWNDVFQNTITSYERGFTPNPDIMCNKYIKFNKFAKYCLNTLNVDVFATGHYAKLSTDTHNNNTILRRPTDRVKDQTFWLCQVDPTVLARCIFPLSEVTKPLVKEIAHNIGLNKTLSRKESMGICFIGKRKFKKFIDSYIEPKSGVFSILETGEIIGEHKGVHHFTLGQKSGLTYGQDTVYVAKMDSLNQEVKVVFNKSHPALFMKSIFTESPHWLGFNPLSSGKQRLRLQYQNKYCSIPCEVEKNDKNNGLTIRLDQWLRCVSPGQYAVLYSEDDEVCIGSAQIISSISAYEEGVKDPIHWDCKDYENQYVLNHDHIQSRAVE